MDEIEFKSFEKTYKKITFALSVNMTYPNPRTNLYRLAAIPLMITSILPLGVLILHEMYQCWKEKDIVNIIRHTTVLGPFLGGFFKMILLYHKRIQARQIVDEITRDYLNFNNYQNKYKEMARASIRHAQDYTESLWALVVIFCVMTFPVMAVCLTSYNFMFKADPDKYMVHDVQFPNQDPEMRFESPYYEIVFVYMCYCAVLYAVNFIGYDGFFGLAINHACLKMTLYCAALEEAMKSDSREVYGRVVGVIKEQSKMFEFVNLIQDTFNIWLGIIFIATMIQIGTCLYLISEGYGIDVRYLIFMAGVVVHIYLPCQYSAKIKEMGYGIDVRYLIFMAGVVVHIYLPCQYSAKIKEMSLETADKIYCSGWENIDSQKVKQIIVFMIARAQVPIQITAFKMINYDMVLFMSIMQTSYSMFTLLRS